MDAIYIVAVGVLIAWNLLQDRRIKSLQADAIRLGQKAMHREFEALRGGHIRIYRGSYEL